MPKIKTDKPSVFARRLVELRKARLLTQAQLAEALGMSTSGIAYYEAVARNPRLKTIEKIASFFEVSPDYLLSEDGPRMEAPPTRIDKIVADLKTLSLHRQRQVCNCFEIILHVYLEKQTKTAKARSAKKAE